MRIMIDLKDGCIHFDGDLASYKVNVCMLKYTLDFGCWMKLMRLHRNQK